MVIDVINQICPDARILHQQEYTKILFPNIDIYTTSYFTVSDKYSRNKSRALELYKDNIFLCCAVGNEGSTSSTELSKLPFWCSIGACDLKNNKLVRMQYSSISEHLDYMSLTNMQTKLGIFTGTSCATPVFASMLVLVQQFFKLKCGRKLTNDELLSFISDNTIDIGEEGFDNLTGNGVFRLPNPDDIDIAKYVNANKVIELEIGNKEAKINGNTYILDSEPIIRNERTLVPIRFIAEALNCEVYWDSISRKVFIIQ